MNNDLIIDCNVTSLQKTNVFKSTNSSFFERGIVLREAGNPLINITEYDDD